MLLYIKKRTILTRQMQQNKSNKTVGKWSNNVASKKNDGSCVFLGQWK